jgi:hypothetical protein
LSAWPSSKILSRARVTRFGLFALVGGAGLHCASLIGLDELAEVDCATSCIETSSSAATSGTRTGATSGATTTRGATSTATSGASGTASTGAGAKSGAGGTASGASSTTGSAGGGRDAGSSASGGSGSGGSGGSIGPDAAADATGGPLEELIDDIEDNRVPHYILSSHGRLGYWFTINDGTPTGTQSPPTGSFRMSSPGMNGTYAAHLSGQGFTDWGIYMGFTLNKSPQGTKNSYDARAYKGISFWAKLGSTDMCTPASACHILRFNVSTRDTDPRAGVCSFCEDHFGTWLTLSASWQKFVVMFDDLRQEGWGVPGPSEGTTFDSSRTYEVQFVVQPAGKPFDYWVDQVSFVLR